VQEGRGIARNDRTNINRNIRAKEVRVIAPDGEQLGILPIHKALATAGDYSLDLVEVSPNARPPVCKIMDYGRYKYEQTKKLQEAKKKQSSFQVKEIKLRPKTGDHDLQTKVGHMKKFLTKKDKVKVTVVFRGRKSPSPSLAGNCSPGSPTRPQNLPLWSSTPSSRVGPWL
jgi:translation initiation factor IF-3